MRAAARYRIPDEPAPSKQEALIVDPFWPLFGQMLVGTWFALPWFLANSLFMGSPTRLREGMLIAASLCGSIVLTLAIDRTYSAGWFHGVDPAYALLAITLLKLGCAYGLYMLQQRPYQLWRHFGGTPKNGMLLVIAAMVFLKPQVMTALGKTLYAIILQ